MASENLTAARKMLDEGGFTCVIVGEQGVLTYKMQGIAPLMECLRSNPEALRDASVADRVIGKAAAMLIAYGGAAEVYAGIISDPGAEFLSSRNISFTCEKRVPYIINRNRTGMCPMEERALGLDDPNDAYQLFDKLVK